MSVETGIGITVNTRPSVGGAGIATVVPPGESMSYPLGQEAGNSLQSGIPSEIGPNNSVPEASITYKFGTGVEPPSEILGKPLSPDTFNPVDRNSNWQVLASDSEQVQGDTGTEPFSTNEKTFDLKDYQEYTAEVAPHLDRVVNEDLTSADWETIVKNPSTELPLQSSTLEGQLQQTSFDEMKENYVKLHILPLVTDQGKVESHAKSPDGAGLDLSSDSSNSERKRIVPAGHAAQEFDANIEEAVQLEQIALALKESAPIGSELAGIDPKKLALDSLNFSLENSQSIPALVTAAETGLESESDAVLRDQADEEEQGDPTLEQMYDNRTGAQENAIQNKSQTELEDVILDRTSTAQEPATKAKGATLNEEEDELTRSELHTGDELAETDPQLLEQELQELVHERDTRAEAERMKDALAAFEVVFDAKNDAEAVVQGAEVTALLPTDPQVDQEKSEIAGERDGALEEFHSEIQDLTVSNMAEAHQNIIYINSKNHAVRTNTTVTSGPVTEEEIRKVQNASTVALDRAA